MLHNIKNDLVVFVIGPNSFTRIHTEVTNTTEYIEKEIGNVENT